MPGHHWAEAGNSDSSGSPSPQPHYRAEHPLEAAHSRTMMNRILMNYAEQTGQYRIIKNSRKSRIVMKEKKFTSLPKTVQNSPECKHFMNSPEQCDRSDDRSIYT